jgi:hypothetical protein
MCSKIEADINFPIRIRDPESYRRGPVFLADLVAFCQCWVSPRTVARATCTIAHRFRAVEPEVVKIWDRFTARIEYADGITHHVEYLLDGEAIAKETIDRVKKGGVGRLATREGLEDAREMVPLGVVVEPLRSGRTQP